MLEQTFVLLPGIGRKRERDLWQCGIEHWSQFIAAGADALPGIGAERKARFDQLLEEAATLLEREDWAPLAARVPVRAHWRFYPHLRDRTVYLDIEPDGTDRSHGIAVVGLYDQYRDSVLQLVAGQDLTGARLREALAFYRCIVTYNGKSFDLPYLERCYPDATPAAVHIDLRHLAQRLGYEGGLKHLEHRLDIAREATVAILRGKDAHRYWRVWRKSKNPHALAMVLRYNREDTVNLARILDALYERLEESLAGRSMRGENESHGAG